MQVCSNVMNLHSRSQFNESSFLAFWVSGPPRLRPKIVIDISWKEKDAACTETTTQGPTRRILKPAPRRIRVRLCGTGKNEEHCKKKKERLSGNEEEHLEGKITQKEHGCDDLEGGAGGNQSHTKVSSRHSTAWKNSCGENDVEVQLRRRSQPREWRHAENAERRSAADRQDND